MTSPGFLRKNGVPYSEKTVLKEYFDLHTERDEPRLRFTPWDWERVMDRGCPVGLGEHE